MVFHEALENQQFNNFIEELCISNYYFSHLFYWQIYSLSKTIRNTYQ